MKRHDEHNDGIAWIREGTVFGRDAFEDEEISRLGQHAIMKTLDM